MIPGRRFRSEVKSYVETNPETAKALQNFAKNPDAMRGWLQTQAWLVKYYSAWVPKVRAFHIVRT